MDNSTVAVTVEFVTQDDYGTCLSFCFKRKVVPHEKLSSLKWSKRTGLIWTNAFKSKNLGNWLTGGFKDLLFRPQSLGKWCYLTCAYFSNGWFNHQLHILFVWKNFISQSSTMASIHLWEKSFIEVPCFMAHRGANDSRSSSRDAWIDGWVVSWFLFEVKVGWMEK